MIITDKFVMLNYPKTGSTFARAVLKKIHEEYNTFPKLFLKKTGLIKKPSMIEFIVSKGTGIKKSQHGDYRQIPEEHRNKKILSIIRNPFQRYISHYLFSWWKDHPELFEKEIDEKFHNFPDLSFKEFYEMLALSAEGECKKNIGAETVRFIKFFFKDPQKTFDNYNDGYMSKKEYLKDMPEIFFIHQENLNAELYNFLLCLNYPENKISFIKNENKINVTPRTKNESKISDFFSSEMIMDVLERDKLLFDLFPEYAKPQC
ncbi:MAG: sulfotransferase family 2 domain-containing protein [Desulfobacter postgatei]|uniref:sulfotransferase family 2 domain-containing protein n=1 Tax=Desulfobacter postgatei TaxID=2293 RepID=UPI0023F2B4B8|nr:sulfotransferase family 2 domain-containing protein [Desulfobacter postgatei]MDD4274565.1 sulfotransferase family 2 domain-containing protein [Desulfobacter postgatei]